MGLGLASRLRALQVEKNGGMWSGSVGLGLKGTGPRGSGRGVDRVLFIFSVPLFSLGWPCPVYFL